jgi:glyoxylase-like metal-dependent hydrolase (beta-lactamase superfamily II)
MSQEITTISVPFAFNFSVKAYLVRSGERYALIDTGMPWRRGVVEEALERVGCEPGDLELLILTHGDTDHAGNAAYLRERYGGRIAMHRRDAEMVEQGDMFASRSGPHPLVKSLLNLFMGLRRSARFTPDLYLEDGDDLSEYGFDLRVLHLQGHSEGSIALLSPEGDLFCGDLMDNTGEPSLGPLVDDPAAARASVERLKGLDVRTVYPGHGEPFALEAFLEKGSPPE